MPFCGYLSLTSFISLLRENWRNRGWLARETRQTQITHKSPLDPETGNQGANSAFHLTELSRYFSGPPFLYLERNNGSFPQRAVVSSELTHCE